MIFLIKNFRRRPPIFLIIFLFKKMSNLHSFVHLMRKNLSKMKKIALNNEVHVIQFINKLEKKCILNFGMLLALNNIFL